MVPNSDPEKGSFLSHSVNPAQRPHWLGLEGSPPRLPATVVEGLSREEVRNPGQWQDAQDTDKPAGVLSAARDTKL